MVQRYKNLKVSDGILDGYGTVRTLTYATERLMKILSQGGAVVSSSGS